MSRSRRTSRWVKALTTLLAVVVLAAGAAAVATGFFAYRFNDVVGRDDVLAEAAGLPAITAEPEYTGKSWIWISPTSSGRPVTVTSGIGRNLLVLGVDTRKGWTEGQSRSDTIMLVHLDAAGSAASVISIPRDSHVYVPPVPGKWAGGKTKINSAYAWGGAALMTQVVSHLTGVGIDHVVRADFAAIRKVTDIVGGVDVHVARTVTDKRTGVTFKAGKQHLNGRRAEIYVRQRYGLPAGDFDRVKRQQQFLRALAEKVTSLGLLANPLKLDGFVTAVGSSLVVDAGLDLAGLVRDLSGLRPDDLTFATVPSSGSVRTPGGVANELDPAGCSELFDALRTDTMARYFAAHPSFAGTTGA